MPRTCLFLTIAFDFNNLCLAGRHRLLATATALAGPAYLRAAIFGLASSWDADVADVERRLKPADRAEYANRQRRWAVRAKPPR